MDGQRLTCSNPPHAFIYMKVDLDSRHPFSVGSNPLNRLNRTGEDVSGASSHGARMLRM